MIGICKLCGFNKKLCKSHIFPKSFTRRMRSGSPQVAVVVAGETPKAIKANGEFVERLLCSECEYLLKFKYEDYGTRLFVGSENIIDSKNYVLIRKFLYRKYFLFLISIFWRASVSTLLIYRSFHGFKTMDEILRSCLVNESLFVGGLSTVRLDSFVSASLLRVVDDQGEFPQEVLDKMIMGLNIKKGDDPADGFICYFMVDGFIACIRIFPSQSLCLASYGDKGRLLNRSFQKVPKVSFRGISEIRGLFDAARAVEDPFCD